MYRLTSRRLILTSIALALAPSCMAKSGPRLCNRRDQGRKRRGTTPGATARADRRIRHCQGLHTTVQNALADLDATDGYFNEKGWQKIGAEVGPAARTGDLNQITKETIEKAATSSLS